MMRTSDEIKVRLNRGIYELRQAQQSLGTVQGRIQTVVNEIQVQSDRADLIDPAIDALNRQIFTLNEDMDRVYSLRNDESDLYLKQENAKLKSDIAELKRAHRREVEQLQAQLANSTKSNEELIHRAQSVERFNDLLKTKINEMKQQYENAIIDNVDLRDTNADLQDTVVSLQSTPAFNVVTNTTDPNGGTSSTAAPFGKTVVETNRGLTVTIESSPIASPNKVGFHHDWIPQTPSSAAFPFPDIGVQPQSTSLTSVNEGSTPVIMRTPGRPKARAIVKGTQEANESFERMRRSLASSNLTNITNTVNLDKNATAASSSSASGFNIPIIKPYPVRPVTPSKVQSKLNPMVAAFTPSNSGGKESARSGSVQPSSPGRNESDSTMMATKIKEEGFVSPHLRRLSKISTNQESVTTIEELPVEDKPKYKETVATSAQNGFAEEDESRQAIPRVLPHLRHLTNVSKNEGVHSPQVQRSDKGKNKVDSIEGTESFLRASPLASMKENVRATPIPGAFVGPDPGLQAWLDSQENPRYNNASNQTLASMTNDTLIEFESPKPDEKQTTSLPPGFIPVSTNDVPTNTETAAPIQTNRAQSPIAVSPHHVTYHNPTVETEAAAAKHEFSNITTSEKERNAAFLAEYNNKLSTVNAKYGRDSRKGSEVKEDAVGPGNPYYFDGANSTSNAPRPVGTHGLGALLDDETSKMVLKPRNPARKMDDDSGVGQEWKAVRKDGKVFYVL